MLNKMLLITVALLLIGGCASNQVNTQNKQDTAKDDEYKNILSHQERFQVLTSYLVQQELDVAKPVFPQEPNEPEIPKAQELVKGKYEKIADFDKRVANEKKKREKLLDSLAKQYAKKVTAYNQEVKRLTDNYNNEVAKRYKKLDEITSEAMHRAYIKVYGTPYLASNPKYDSETERFFARVKASKGGFNESVAIDVPINQAEDFDKNLAKAKVKVTFNFANDNLVLKGIEVKNGRLDYIARLTDVNFKAENFSVALGGEKLQLPKTPLLSSSLSISEDAYSLGTINYSKDPEIARLQKIKYELEQSAANQKLNNQKEADLFRQRNALEAQIAQLEQKVGGVDDLDKYLKKAKPAKLDNKKWLFIVAIENYEFTDPVVYSANSAKRFKEVAQKRLGVPESNTRFLLNQGATAARINHHLREMLSRVKQGDTVYVYYSGHGVPVAKQNNTPYMLAQDMSPEYVGDDQRFQLQNFYRQLSDSKAGKVVGFIDSCFSGGADNTALFKGVAATRLKPKSVTFNKDKMVILTAGSDLEYSNMYEQKSNRLFSYYLMRGLIDNNTDIEKLHNYVKLNVQEKSYQMGVSYEQVPVFDGNIKLGL